MRFTSSDGPQAEDSWGLGVRVNRVDPVHTPRVFGDRDVEVDDYGLLVAANQDALKRLILAGVDLLVWHIGRHIDEIPGARFTDELELLAPAHSRFAGKDVDDAFERTVMVRAGFGVRVDVHCARPEFAGAGGGEVDGRRPVHSGRLGRIGVQVSPRDDFHSLAFPVDFPAHGARIPQGLL